MPERPQKIDIPFFEEMASSLKREGSFQGSFNSSQVSEVMTGVVSSLVSGTDAVTANVAQMSVGIENRQGSVSGTVQVSRPIQATIGLKCVLGNSDQPNRLRLVSLQVDEQGKGVKDRLALKAIGIKGKAKQKLSNPNAALFESFQRQMNPRGINLTAIGLSFQEDDTLSIRLRGESLQK